MSKTLRYTYSGGPIHDVIEHDGDNPECPCGPTATGVFTDHDGVSVTGLQHHRMEGRLTRQLVVALAEVPNLLKQMTAVLTEVKALLVEQRGHS